MLYLVTGGLGYLGGRLVEYLLQEGHEIRITTRRSRESLPDWAKGYDIHKTDMQDKEIWTEALEGVDFVFHLAAPDARQAASDPISALRAGGEFTWNLLEAVANAKRQVPVIKVSTFHVYGPLVEGLIRESSCPSPEHPYAVGHLISEMVVQIFCSRRGIRGLNVRLSNALGKPVTSEACNWSLVFNDLCMQAATSDQLRLKSTGHQKRNFITLGDTVRALSFLAESRRVWPEDHVIHVGSSTHWSMRQAAEIVAGRCDKLWGKYPEIIFPKDEAESAPKDFVFDVSRLERAGFIWENQFDREIDDTLTTCKKWS
jgi:UDP-glucose 4-epimerase